MALSVRVVAYLAEGLGMRATTRVFEVDPTTVLHGLVEAAEQLTAFSSHLLGEGHVQQVQRDALDAGLSAVKDGQMRTEEALRRLSCSPQWVWTTIDPPSKRLLAQRGVQQGREGRAPGCLPLCVTDGLKASMRALLSHCGSWVPPERRQAPGPAPTPRWMPLPARL